MLVFKNDQAYKVEWIHTNPELERLLSEKGIDADGFRKLKHLEKVEKLQEKGYTAQIPLPSVTTCIISQNEKSLRAITVTRHKKDAHNKGKARTYSLHKVLHAQFPGRENREVRKAFWETYLNRSVDTTVYPANQ